MWHLLILVCCKRCGMKMLGALHRRISWPMGLLIRIWPWVKPLAWLLPAEKPWKWTKVALLFWPIATSWFPPRWDWCPTPTSLSGAFWSITLACFSCGRTPRSQPSTRKLAHSIVDASLVPDSWSFERICEMWICHYVPRVAFEA